MKSLLASMTALALTLAGSAGTAFAQYGPIYRPGLYPYGTPGLSPYLDLTRGGNRATNYFLGTIPEIERRRNTAVFGAAIQDLERRSVVTEPSADELVPTLPSTGHPVAFQNYYPYYLIGPAPNAQARQQQTVAPRKR
jgi:hypothetical protein